MNSDTTHQAESSSNVSICSTPTLKQPIINFIFWYIALFATITINYFILSQIPEIDNLLIPISIFSIPSALATVISLAWVEGYLYAIQFTLCRLTAIVIGPIFILSYAADAFLYSNLSIHITTAIRLLTEGGVQHFTRIIDASGVKFLSFRPPLLSALTVFGISTILTVWSRKITAHRILVVRTPGILATLCFVITTAFIIDNISPRVSPSFRYLWKESHKTLPVLVGRIQRQEGPRLIDAPFPPLPALRPSTPSIFSSNALPNIILIILESTPRDLITPTNSPHIHAFAQKCLPLKQSYSGANATHLSFFSLLTGHSSLHFATALNSHQPELSFPIFTLHNFGYELHAFSSSHFQYCGLETVVFGNKTNLFSSYFDARYMEELEPFERDKIITQKVESLLKQRASGNLFILFYESTHHDYYFPFDYPTPFTPYAESWNYLDITPNPNRAERIRNRYRNALHYVDSLVSRIISQSDINGNNPPILVITGDHGEEFFERGKLTHGSDLCRQQIQVPIFISLPKFAHHQLSIEIASHADVFPTILDYLNIPKIDGLYGSSLLRPNLPGRIVSWNNGLRTPYRFCVCTPTRKYWLEYVNPYVQAHFQAQLNLTKVTDHNDEVLTDSLEYHVSNPQLLASLRQLYPTIKPSP